MFLIPLFMGGKNKSKQLYEEITEITNNVLNKITTNLKNSATSDQYNRQIVEVDFSNAHIDCGIEIAQSSIITTNILLEAKSEISSDMSAQIINDIMSKVSQKLEQVNSGINIPTQENKSEVETKIRTTLNTEIKNIIETNIDNVVSAKQGSAQTIIVKASGLRMLKCPQNGVGIRITQSNLLDAVAKNISASVLETIVSLEQMNTITRDIEQDVKQKNAGIDSSMSLISSICIVIIVGLVVTGPIIAPKMMGIQKDSTKVFIVVLCSVLLLCCCFSCSMSSSQSRKNQNNEYMFDKKVSE